MLIDKGIVNKIVSIIIVVTFLILGKAYPEGIEKQLGPTEGVERTKLRVPMAFGARSGNSADRWGNLQEGLDSAKGQKGAHELWNKLYSPAEIRQILLNPSIPHNRYRLSASIALLSEAEQNALPSGWMSYLTEGNMYLKDAAAASSIPNSSYMPWMELDHFVEELDVYEPGDYKASLQALVEATETAGLRAHGVAENKGGIAALLSIMLEGRLRQDTSDNRTYFGILGAALQSYGPYYVVIDHEKMARKGLLFKANDAEYCLGDLSSVYHKCYIVPSAYERDFLIRGLKEAKEMGLVVRGRVITEEYVQGIISKIKTYDEVIQTEGLASYIAAIVKEGGGKYEGIQEDPETGARWVVFSDREGYSLMLPEEGINSYAVAIEIARKQNDRNWLSGKFKGPFAFKDAHGRTDLCYIRITDSNKDIENILDRWFSTNRNFFFDRDRWRINIASYIYRRKEQMRLPNGFLIALESKKGEILGLAFFHKEDEFMFYRSEDGREVDVAPVYFFDMMEISERYRGQGLGKILTAKIFEKALGDPDIGQRVVLGEPATLRSDKFFATMGADKIYIDREGNTSELFGEEDEWKRRFRIFDRSIAEKCLSKIKAMVLGEQMSLFGEEALAGLSSRAASARQLELNL